MQCVGRAWGRTTQTEGAASRELSLSEAQEQGAWVWVNREGVVKITQGLWLGLRSLGSQWRT